MSATPMIPVIPMPPSPPSPLVDPLPAPPGAGADVPGAGANVAGAGAVLVAAEPNALIVDTTAAGKSPWRNPGSSVFVVTASSSASVIASSPGVASQIWS